MCISIYMFLNLIYSLRNLKFFKKKSFKEELHEILKSFKYARTCEQNKKN